MRFILFSKFYDWFLSLLIWKMETFVKYKLKYVASFLCVSYYNFLKVTFSSKDIYPLKILFYLKKTFSLLIMNTLFCQCIWDQVPKKDWEFDTPGAEVTGRSEPQDMGGRNRTQALWKRSRHSSLWNHLFSFMRKPHYFVICLIKSIAYSYTLIKIVLR